MDNLWATLLVAIGGGIPSVIAVVLSNRSHDKVIRGLHHGVAALRAVGGGPAAGKTGPRDLFHRDQ